jgi:hypothetical protein
MSQENGCGKTSARTQDVHRIVQRSDPRRDLVCIKRVEHRCSNKGPDANVRPERCRERPRLPSTSQTPSTAPNASGVRLVIVEIASPSPPIENARRIDSANYNESE